MTICCLEKVENGLIPVSDVEFKDRTFSMTANDAQSLIENPGTILKGIKSAFSDSSKSDTKKIIIRKIMELMTFLKMSQSKPKECTDIYVNV